MGGWAGGRGRNPEEKETESVLGGREKGGGVGNEE